MNEILALLLANVRETLGGRFVGMYLYGSLSGGDFNTETSDIDVMVATDAMLPDQTIEALRAMHERFAPKGAGRAHWLEASYLPRAELRRFKPMSGPFPYWGEEGFKRFHPGGDWIIQRHILREQGVVVAGPPPREMIDPVTPDDLRWGVSDVLQGWWAGQAENPDWIGRETVLGVFAVQTMCRALVTLQTGEVCSKPAALRWGMESLAEPWRALAEQASRWVEGMPFASLDQTAALIRYTVERSRTFRLIHPEPKYTMGGAVEAE